MKIKRKKEKNNAYECTNALSEGRELTLNAFKSEIFSLRPTQVENLLLMLLKLVYSH